MVRKKGFTLIELLAIMAMLGIILAIAIPNLFAVVHSSKDKAFKALMDTFESDAAIYTSKHRDTITSSINSQGYYEITLQNLLNEGLIKEGIKDPRTNTVVSLGKKVVVTIDEDGSFNYCYEDNNCMTPKPYLATKFTAASAGPNGSYVNKNGSNYFVGSNPYNWLTFGQVSDANPTPLMWRIIKSDSGGIKIIYEGFQNGTSTPLDDGRIIIDGSWTTPWDINNTNKWEAPASLKSKLQTWYNSLYIANRNDYVQPIQWCTGGVLFNNPTTLAQFKDAECVNQTAAGGTFQGLTTNTTVVGLIKPSDYVSTSSAATCTGSYQSSGNNNGNDCGTSNFLAKVAYNWWTMNANASSSSYVYNILKTGAIGYNYSANMATSNSIRPVINLKANVFYTSGSGTLTDPYRIGITSNGNNDTIPPVIVVNGSNPITVSLGSTYTDAGATATDNLDGVITNNIITTSTVNVNIPGTYTVTYSVYDSAGNKAETQIRTVYVFAYNYAYNYTGSHQTFIAPYTGNYQIEAWGASGGSYDSTYSGGLGGYTKGTINLNKNDKIYIHVGGQGTLTGSTVNECIAGGYNGGGMGCNSQVGAGRYGGSGGGATDVRIGTQKYRYIRDYLNGSTTNAGNHWVEIQVLTKDGVNVALNKTITGSSIELTGYPYSRIVDGSTATATYAQSNYNGLQYIEIDLGAEYDINAVIVWHYYNDSRTYHNTKTILYSADRGTQSTIFDSASNGEYTETSSGGTYDLSLRNRIMVAGGGGGAWYSSANYYGKGGSGGGVYGRDGIGYNAGTYYYPSGGTQTGPGSTGTNFGEFGYGASITSAAEKPGAGGGYYGGNVSLFSSAGGSSFISGDDRCNAIDLSGTPTGQADHFSGYVFTNTVITAGNASMPAPAGGTETGHNGNGYAKITYIP